MNPKLKLLSIALCQLSIIIALTVFTACTGKDSSQEQATYTCPMHPGVIADRPGTCPVCGMDLVLKSRHGEEVVITEDLAKLIRSPNETIVAAIKTIKGEFKSIPVSVEAQGVVMYDTRNIYTIPARVSGRIEKLYLKSAFQAVTKGQKIAEIYSPELITAQRELLFLIENDAENTPLIEASKSKLLLLGFQASQIDNLIRTRELKATFNIFSPYDGYLISGESAPSTPASISSVPASEEMRMGSPSSTSSSSAETNSQGQFISEGNYVSAGQTLFKIVNTKALRIELDLPGAQSGLIKTGDKVKLDFGDGHSDEVSVDFVQPFFTEGQDFLKVRVYTNKIKDLHIGHLVNANLKLQPIESLWIPKESVLDLGGDKIVFVKDRGVFKPKRISAGISTGGLIEIKSGLASSEEIAGNAQYLVDSESFIKPVK